MEKKALSLLFPLYSLHHKHGFNIYFFLSQSSAKRKLPQKYRIKVNFAQINDIKLGNLELSEDFYPILFYDNNFMTKFYPYC